jgi:hypothetical protein
MEAGASGRASAGERTARRGWGFGGLLRSTRQLAQGQASRSFRQLMRWVTPSLHSISSESPTFFKPRGEGVTFQPFEVASGTDALLPDHYTRQQVASKIRRSEFPMSRILTHLIVK